MAVRISLLNHACIKCELDDVSLLFDPWLSGTCFRNGWGLRYKNEKAVEEAITSTHLWISHYHGDHLHIPTLQAISSKNNNIKVIANKSLNFEMEPSLRAGGFKNIIPLPERKEIHLTKNVTIIRYPTAGIDNMLLIKTPSCTILNYNDVNLPNRSLKALCKQFPKIDILFCNFNHANRLLEHPLRPTEEIKKELVIQFLNKLKIIQSKWVIPFASYHWYLNPYCTEQNKTLMTNTELKFWLKKLGTEAKKVLPVNVGQHVDFDDKIESPQINGESAVEQNGEELDFVKPNPSSDNELLELSKKFNERIIKKSTFFKFFMKPLRILVIDFQKVLVIERRGCYYSKESNHYDISADSGILRDWFTLTFGTDGFFNGAHFKTESKNLLPLKRLFLFALLEENRLSPRDFFSYLTHSVGRRFLRCRREEIVGTLLENAFKVGSRTRPYD